MSKEKRPASYSAVQKEIGDRIRWVRELIEPNRAQLARDMGVDKSTLAKIEEGERPPSVFNVLDLSHRLNVTPDYILKGTLRGLDGELAGLLASKHPELAQRSHTATDSGTDAQPRKPKLA